MNKYAVKVINHNLIHTPEECEEAIKKAPEHYCTGLQNVFAYCGGKLHKHRFGYSGMSGNIEYIAYRVS